MDEIGSAIFSVINTICLEDGDDEEDDFIYNEEQAVMTLLSQGIKEKNKRVCIKGYAEMVVPLYSNKDFKSHFRLNRSTFEVLLREIGKHQATKNLGRPPIDLEKQLLSIIWLLANQETFRSVADRFDLAKSSLHELLIKTCKLLSQMAPQVITWPRISEVVADFESICGFPNVVGAIDGTHIKINAPSEHPQRYYNRKGDHSIILQAVCRPDLAFTHVFCSFPGAVHDSRVLRNSEVFNLMFGNTSFFPNNEHLIGDSAYPLHINLLVPYKDNGHLARRQMNYNTKLSKSRVCIERAFGQLKGRFRRLKYFDVGNISMLPLYVLATCVLHNICVKESDFIEDVENEDDSDDESPDEPGTSQVAINKRDYVCGLLQ